MQDYEKAVLKANLAEAAQLCDDQCEFMRERVEKGGPLTAEERDLFSAGYHFALEGRRQAARVASLIEEQERNAGNMDRASLAGGFKTRVQVRVCDLCEQCTHLLESRLLPGAESGEPKTCYLKMLGDYYRYIAEICILDDTTSGKVSYRREPVTRAAQEAYMAGMQEAKHHLLPTHPVRICLALNYAKFQYQILDDIQAALETANWALATAAGDLETMPRKAHDDAEPHLTTLRAFIHSLGRLH